MIHYLLILQINLKCFAISNAVRNFFQAMSFFASILSDVDKVFFSNGSIDMRYRAVNEALRSDGSVMRAKIKLSLG